MADPQAALATQLRNIETKTGKRLKALPPGGMCQYTVRLSSAAEIDAALLAWVRAAYDAAG